MPISSVKRPHILFLFSDTGGGHRSAAEAIIEAIHLEFGDNLSTEMVDFFHYAPRPLDRMPALYPQMVRLPELWGLGYRLSNGRRRARFITDTSWPYTRQAVQRLLREHPCDLYVSVHPLITSPALHLLGPNRPPFITVVTDLATTHAYWYDRRVDLCLVPTEEAYRRALKWKVPAEKVHIVGLPVADRFCQPPGDRAEMRQALGWPQDLPMTLMVGGGEGMGPLEESAVAIAESGFRSGLAVVAGRNQKLKKRLEERSWPQPTFIYGFMRNMPDLMRAADVLVTKAGPGTVTEALNAGLPMILYSRLPGQEDGNVSFVTEVGAGFWAPRPQQIVAQLAVLLGEPRRYALAAAACRQLARPQAARQIARLIAERAGVVV